jgi:AcrR family transcriptional regulator
MAEEPNHRRRHAAVRRREILQAATRLFGQKGFDRATTKEIAAEADISEGTIYKYFRNKHELLMNIIEEVVPGLFNKELLLPDQAGVRERFTVGFERVLDYICAHREMLSVLVSEVGRNQDIQREWVTIYGQELLQRLKERLDLLAAAGEMRPVNTALAARLMISAAMGLGATILFGGTPPPSPEERRHLAESLTDLLLNGMLTRQEQPDA